MSAPGAYGCSPFRRFDATMKPGATAAPPDNSIRDPADCDLAADLTRRAGRDPAWWLVVRQYALGHARWPDPFHPRKPSAP